MTTHTVGTREEWLVARVELLADEKQLTRRSDAIARRRQDLPWVPVEREYTIAPGRLSRLRNDVRSPGGRRRRRSLESRTAAITASAESTPAVTTAAGPRAGRRGSQNANLAGSLDTNATYLIRRRP